MITQADIKPILGGVQNNLSLSTLQPFIIIAESKFKQEFSVALFNHIQSITDNTSELLSAYKSLIVWHAYSIAQPHIHVRLGDAGMAKNMPTNSVMLTKWEYVKLEESNLSVLDFFFEHFYHLLDQADLEVYKSSAEAARRAKLSISTAAQFSEYFPQMGGSVRLFSKVKPFIYNVEQQLKAKLTPEVFSQITTPVALGVSPSVVEGLSYMAYMYITHLSIYEALPFISVNISEEGLHVVVKMDGTRNELQAEKSHVNALRTSLYNTAKLQLESLILELHSLASPSVFSAFYNKFVLPNQTQTTVHDPKSSPIL